MKSHGRGLVVEGGRYSVKKVYSIDGKFLRMLGDKERE